MRPCLGLQLRVIHEIGRLVRSVGVLLSEQEAGDVARIIHRQAQAGHDGHLVYDKFVTIVRASRMILVKHKREVVLRVILRAQVLLFVRTVGARSNPRVQDPRTR